MTPSPHGAQMVTDVSIFDHVLAPAPRYMMRLALIAAQLRYLLHIEHFLEIGPGLGDLSMHLADRYPAARGDLIDVSAGSEAVTRTRVRDRLQLRVLRGDFHDLVRQEPYNVYDLIIACEVFEHIADDEAAFAAVRTLLSSGGHFLFSVPAFGSHWQAGDEYAGHYRRYERAELITKFARHGLIIELLWCYGFPLTNLLSPLTHLYYQHKLRNRHLTRETATEHSGIERDVARRFSARSMATLLCPLFWVQHLVREHDIGDGYLILAHRP